MYMHCIPFICCAAIIKGNGSDGVLCPFHCIGTIKLLESRARDKLHHQLFSFYPFLDEKKLWRPGPSISCGKVFAKLYRRVSVG